MDKVSKVILFLSIVFAVGFGVLGYFLSNISSTLNEFQESSNIKLNSINNSLWLESEEHFLEVREKIDKSIVGVVSLSDNIDESDNNVVLYVDKQGRTWSLGTGFSFNEDGDILTAYHIVKDAKTVGIIFRNGTIKEVLNIVNFPELDMTMLDANTLLPPVKLRNTNVKIGSSVAFIGFPLDEKTRVFSKGTISAVIPHTYSEKNIPVPVYVINSFVNRGNSGGPVFSLKDGEVTGIINARDTQKEGIGISTFINKELIEFLESKTNLR